MWYSAIVASVLAWRCLSRCSGWTFFWFSGNGRYVGITGARIPDKVRFNQVIFRYYVLAETQRILSETIEGLDTPRFLELLSADDKDKVLRLAAKLNEVEARSD